MTNVVSLRIPSRKLLELDRRVAISGLDRSKYLMRLLEDDLERPGPKVERRFASAHLLGKYRSKGSSNADVRAAVKARLKGAKNR